MSIRSIDVNGTRGPSTVLFHDGNPANAEQDKIGAGVNPDRPEMNSLLKLGTAAALLAVAMPNFAQDATAAQKAGYANRHDFGVLHMNTKLGSFKIIDGEGRLEFSFTGTVLITKLKGKATFAQGSKVRKEYDKRGRAVYTGTGKLVVDGTWRGVQWFGKDMEAVFWGKGAARIQGEFDRNLRTGDYWFDDKDRALPFPASAVMTIFIPPPNYGADPNVKPTPRQGGLAGPGGGKSSGGN